MLTPKPQNSTPSEERFKVSHLANSLKVSPNWVRDHARELGGKKIGRLWFFTREGVDHALQGKGRIPRQSYNQQESIYKEMQNQEGGFSMGATKTKRIKATSDPYGLLA